VKKVLNIATKILPYLSNELLLYFKGILDLQASTIYQMFINSQQLQHYCCNKLSEISDEQLRQHWLVKMSAKSPSIYQLLCEILVNDHVSFVAKFVKSTSTHCNIFELYSFNEQVCVILFQFSMDSSVEHLHIPKLMKEMLALWDDNPESVVKLILHFPFIIKWFIAYCDKDICAQRLSLRLFNCVK